MYHLVVERVRTSGLFPVTTMLTEVRLCLELRDELITISQSSLACDIWPSQLCHRFESRDLATFTAPSGLINISGYKLLYLYPFPIFRFPRLIVHGDSLRVVLYPTSANMPMETRLLFSTGMCQTSSRVMVLSFGNWMRTTSIPAIAHSCPFPSWTVLVALVE